MAKKPQIVEVIPPEIPCQSSDYAEANSIGDVTWSEKVFRLNDLRPFERNPRRISEIQFAKLKQSLIEDGYHSRIKATADGRVMGGHQRLRALRELGVEFVKVLVPDHEISDRQFIRIMVRDNHNNGVFDLDAMANMFDLEELRDFGLHEISGIAPMPDGEEEKPKAQVCCPQCGHVFPTKGNKAN